MLKLLKISIVAGATALAGTAWAEMKITYGSWAPSTDPFSVAMEPFIESVKEKSNGEISFETHFDSSVVQMRTVLSGIKDGLVDAGYIAGSIFQAELPIDTMLTQYASIPADPFAISGAVSDFMLTECPECTKAAEANGVKPLAYAGTPHFYIMCKNPVRSFDELKGKSMRAASANLRMVEKIGATPVNTPTVEVLEAMQRGQVECAVGSSFWLQAYSLWDVVRYVVDMPVGQYNNGMIFGVNQDLWAEMSEENKNAILDSLPVLVANAAAAGYEKAQSIRAESIEKGVVWEEPTPEMRAFLEEWFKSERAAVQGWGEERQINDVAGILDGFEATVEKWNGISAEIGADKDKFQQKLIDEVYSEL